MLEILCFLNQHLNLLVQFSNKLESFCNYRQCENYEYLNDKSSKKLWFICLIICLCRVVHVPPTIDIHAIVSRGDKHNFYDWMVTFFHTFFFLLHPPTTLGSYFAWPSVLRMLNSDIVAWMCHSWCHQLWPHSYFSCTWFHGKSPFKSGPFFTSDPIWMGPIVKRFPQMWKSTPVNRPYHYLSWICTVKEK